MPKVRAESWVIYESSAHAKGRRVALVCEQAEWDAIGPDLLRNYVLIQTGIMNEGDAERLARHHLPPERDRPRRVA
jgi:hypothetical protein